MFLTQPLLLGCFDIYYLRKNCCLQFFSVSFEFIIHLVDYPYQENHESYNEYFLQCIYFLGERNTFEMLYFSLKFMVKILQVLVLQISKMTLKKKVAFKNHFLLISKRYHYIM